MPDAELRSEDNEQVLTNLLESPERQVYVITEVLPVSPHSSVTTKYLLQRSNTGHRTFDEIDNNSMPAGERGVWCHRPPPPAVLGHHQGSLSYHTHQMETSEEDISLWSGLLSSFRDSNICVQQLKFKFWTVHVCHIILTKIFLRLNRPLSQNQLYFHESWYDKYFLHYSILFFISFIIDFEY